MGFSFTTSLFIGAALSNTSTDILARIVEWHRLGLVLLGAALIDDISAVYIIGLVSAVALGQTLDLISVVRVTALIMIFFVAVGIASRELLVKRNVMRALWCFEERG